MGLAEQAKTPGRMTLLDGVNVMLESIGEMPVDSIEDSTAAECHIAARALLEIHKEAQTRGWGWNTDRRMPFYVDSARQLHVPANVVRWVPDPYEWGRRFQQRGQQVWDRETFSYRIPDGIDVVYADVVTLLPWDQCPEQFNRWVTTRAARVFGARVLGNDSLVKFTLKDEQDALLELQRMEAENENWNILTDGPLMPEVAWPTYQPGMGELSRQVSGGVPIGVFRRG